MTKLYNHRPSTSNQKDLWKPQIGQSNPKRVFVKQGSIGGDCDMETNLWRPQPQRRI